MTWEIWKPRIILAQKVCMVLGLICMIGAIVGLVIGFVRWAGV